MYVSDWMTKQVVTSGPDETIEAAVRAMQKKGVKHLVVVEDGAVRGVLSEHDVRAFTPSRSAVRYLVAKARVSEAMAPKVVVVPPRTPVEEAARMMLERKIRCLPVVEEGRLVGILSDRDIFRALVDISGVRHGGHRICVTVEDRSGTVREVTDVARRLGFHLKTILTSYEGVPKGMRRVVIRTTTEGDFEALRSVLEAVYRDVEILKG
jgi:acetoin utilization protein AcuB